ncbi:hypothetical protein SNE40_004898 [Patella caerulea]|uniref:NTR domain-containing protein n=1 Tax=Patella caerulea TaxID=87958 RepID=A0AAN8K5N3_PATCE
MLFGSTSNVVVLLCTISYITCLNNFTQSSDNTTDAPSAYINITYGLDGIEPDVNSSSIIPETTTTASGIQASSPPKTSYYYGTTSPQLTSPTPSTTTKSGSKKWHHPIIWDNWSFWGLCSRTCGEGIKIRTRKCLVWTGTYFARTHLTACEGTNIGYKVCSKRKCAGESRDYRDEQCKSLSKKPFLGRKALTWKPVYSKDRPCELNCQADVRSNYYNFGQVQDGTRCSTTDYYVCIEGICKRVGCDGIIESPTKVDMCGICDGENDTCTFIQKTVMSRFPRHDTEFPGYYRIVTIPRGSRHFKVLDNSRNNIALMDNDHNFIINGNRNLSQAGNYNVSGTSVLYLRSETFGELFQGEGPLTEDVHIMLLYRQRHHEIKYEFWKPNIGDNSTQIPVTSPTSRSTQNQQTTRAPTLSDDQIWKMLISELNEKQHVTGSGRRTDVYSSKYKPQANKSHSNKRKNEVEIYSPSIPDVTYTRRHKYKKRLKFETKNCRKCPKVKNRKAQFCKSDFVSRVRILGAEIINGETRYDVSIIKSYKKGFTLMQREYLWVPNACKCPRLRINGDFLVMGKFSSVHRREIRLSVAPDSYIRRYKSRYEPKLYRMNRKLKCK